MITDKEIDDFTAEFYKYACHQLESRNQPLYFGMFELDENASIAIIKECVEFMNGWFKFYKHDEKYNISSLIKMGSHNIDKWKEVQP